MEKKSIVTNRETKISKMVIDQTEHSETGVKCSFKSEVVTESNVIKTEIVTENTGCYGNSKLPGDASAYQNNDKLMTEPKVPPLFDISGGDFAGIRATLNSAMMDDEQTLANGASGGDFAGIRPTFTTGIGDGVTFANGTSGEHFAGIRPRVGIVDGVILANGSSGESRSSADQSKNGCKNRKIGKKRKTRDSDLEVGSDSFDLRDSHHRQPLPFMNFRRRSAPLKARLQSAKVSQEFGDQREAISCKNKILSFDSASSMKIADESKFESGSPSSLRLTKETAKSKDDSQALNEVLVSAETSAVDSISAPGSSKERNAGEEQEQFRIVHVKEEHRPKCNATPLNRRCKKELIKNLEKSVTDLVNYFENLHKSSLVGKGVKSADDVPEKSVGATKLRTQNKYPDRESVRVKGNSMKLANDISEECQGAAKDRLQTQNKYPDGKSVRVEGNSMKLIDDIPEESIDTAKEKLRTQKKYPNEESVKVEGNSMKLADDISEESQGAAKEKLRTQNQYPDGESARTLHSMGRHNKTVKSGISRENCAKTQKNKTFGFRSKIAEDPPKNNFKHHPRERFPNIIQGSRTCIISDQVPASFPPKKDYVHKSSFHKKDKYSATTESSSAITYLGIFLLVVSFTAASLKILLTFAE